MKIIFNARDPIKIVSIQLLSIVKSSLSSNFLCLDNAHLTHFSEADSARLRQLNRLQ